MSVLSVNGLSKSYAKVQALKDVSFTVPAGSVFGILGPNGSGKTTLLGTVLEILFPSAGNFCWFDDRSTPPATLRQRIGTLLETPNFYPYMTGAQNLAVTASVRGRGSESIPEVLKQVGLDGAAKLNFSQYSLGMKQRLAIGGALLGDPEVLVLDEPTNGLDPAGIADVRSVISELKGKGKTIILASHLLDEVEKVCSHVAILKKGTLLQSGTMQEVLKEETSIDVEAGDLAALEAALRSHPDLHLSPLDAGFRVGGPISAEELNRFCFEKGVALSSLRTRKRDLESAFLELTDD